MEVGRIKGVVVRQLLGWYETKLGREQLKRVLHKLPSELAAQIDLGREGQGILASTWYPAPLLHALLESMVIVGYEPGKLARDAAEAIMGSTMHGIYKSLFRRLATPRMYARFGGTAWSTYHDTGKCTFEFVREGLILSRVNGWTGHHPIVCDMNLLAGELIFTAMNCVNVKVRRTACVSRGDSECGSEISWTASGSQSTP